jgi:acetyl-CoA synthetase
MSEKGIEVFTGESKTFAPPGWFSEKAHIQSISQYEEMYKRSVEDPEGFWAEMAEKYITWYKKWDKVLEYDFHKPEIKWFSGGKLNTSYNCIDRHLESERRNKAAIIWEADDGSYKSYTYQQLSYEVNRFANVLKKKGVKKGDRVTIGRPGDHLPAHDSGTRLLHACLRQNRRHPQHRLRRVLVELPPGQDQ